MNVNLSFSERLGVIEDKLAEVIGKLLSETSTTTQEIVKETGVSRNKIRLFTVGTKGSQASAPAGNSEISISQMARLLAYCEKRELQNHPHIDVSEPYKELRALTNDENTTQIDYSDLIDINALNEASSVPEASIELIVGRYLTFRRAPNTKKILVSAIEVSRDERRDIIVWRNCHPVNNSTVSFSGIVVYHGSHFVFLGQRSDHRFINTIAVRSPEIDGDHRHGIALTVTQHEPTACSIYFLRDNKRSLDELSGLCGVFDFAHCKKMGLESEDFVNPFPTEIDDNGNENVDSKQALVARFI